MSHEAIRIVHENAVTINGDIPNAQAWDENGVEIELDLPAIEAAQTTVDANQAAKKLAEETAKQSAISKLTALGLNTEEISALLGIK